MNSLEKFKDIEGYEGLYQITSWGRVYSLIANKFMKTELTDKGYLRVKLRKNKKAKNHKVHRLVASAFIPNMKNLPQVNHKDGNKQNNSVTNLEWITDSDNKQHAKRLKEK